MSSASARRIRSSSCWEFQSREGNSPLRGAIQLFEPRLQLLQLKLLLGQRRLHPADDFFWRAATEGFVAQLPFLRGDRFFEGFDLLAKAYFFSRNVDCIGGVGNSDIKL